MNERLITWQKEIENQTNIFKQKFETLSIDQLNWKPSSASWSIGEVIEHLILTTNGYLGIPDLIKQNDFKPSFFSKFKFYPKFIGKLILKSVDPNTKKKVKTMKKFTPQESKIANNVLDEFIESQNKLSQMINDNGNEILNRVIIPSPVSRHIVYHFDTVIDIIINHQKRHFNQAINVLDQILTGK